MNKNILVLRTAYDGGTFYLYEWTGVVIENAGLKGFDVSDLKKEKANRKNFYGLLKSTNPIFVFLNGHGDNNTFYGHDDEEIITTSSTTGLKNKIVYARACGCSTQLGDKAVQEGCVAFIGYSDYFDIPIQNSRSATPLHDPIAKPVMEASNVIATALIKGNTVGEAVEHSHKLVKKELRKILFSGRYKEDLECRDTFEKLYMNDKHLDFKGDENAKLIQ
jgi:hypothetical protein